MNELYLVTGGTGFLGSHIVSELIGENKRVRVLALPGDKSVGHLANSVEICYGDLCSEKDLEKFFQTDESVKEVYVLHVASMVTVNPDYSQKLIDINVNGTANIINMCKKYQAFKRLLYVSSTGAIPELKKGNKIKEVDFFIPEEVVGWYSKSKAMATNEVMNAVKNDNLDAVVVFPSGIMGPVDWLGGETTKTIIKIINGEMPMGINGSFNLVDVRDLATGCIQALKKGKKGEGYILANEEIRFKDLCKILRKELKCKVPKFFLPIGISYSMAKMMEKKAKKKGTTPLMTQFSIYNLDRNNSFDYSKAQRELGFKCRGYTQTIIDEAKWLGENGFVKN